MTTVQDIVSATAQDVQTLLGPEHPALIDYCNRVHLEILKYSRWRFLLSAPQRFVTRYGQTDYWIGATGSGPNNIPDTGLNITNLGTIKQGTVWDRSNFRKLGKTDEPPNIRRYAWRDGSYRLGLPANWRNDVETPSVFSLYPAPDNQNGWAPVPEPPLLASSTGGVLAARTYYIKTAFVDSAGGVSAASQESVRVLAEGTLATVAPPTLDIAANDQGVSYSSYNVYASTTSGDEQLQNASPLALTAVWTEPATGLIAGTSAPTSSTLATINGYIIEFRYFQGRTQLTSLTDELVVPDDYKDCVIAGVNAKAYVLLMATDQAANYAQQVGYWTTTYESLRTGIVRDFNQFPRGSEFIRPDASAASLTMEGVEPYDITMTQI